MINLKSLDIDTWKQEFTEDECNFDKVQEYLEFIKEAINRYDSSRYSELHHVIPRCVNRESKYDNEVSRINGRDHFLAHKKLVDCFNGLLYYKLMHSFGMMSRLIKQKEINEEEYEQVAQYIKGSRSGILHPMYGKHHSEETKKKMSNKRQPGMTGAYWYGKSIPEETRRKISKTKKSLKQSSGVNNPMYGKHHTEETRRTISEKNKGKVSARKGVTLSKETKKKLSESLKGFHWYTDGKNNLRIKDQDCVPDGFFPGRTL